MTTTAIFLAAYFCVLNQFLSRNLAFIIVAAACCFALFTVWLCKRTERWFWMLPSVALNLILLPSTIEMHNNLQGLINDYAVCAVVLILTTVLLVLDVLPTKKKAKHLPDRQVFAFGGYLYEKLINRVVCEDLYLLVPFHLHPDDRFFL